MPPQEKLNAVCERIGWPDYIAEGYPSSVTEKSRRIVPLRPASVDDLLRVCEFGKFGINIHSGTESCRAHVESDIGYADSGEQPAYQLAAALLDAMEEATR